ncbi:MULTISPECIES: hypothetical protein [Klebsiella]|jgi:hypothetical protein|uniref:Uncharacterized protein n=1 Tax=Klebsiella pneumoniae TaxID=573 RepID=A0A483F3F3_KLEPN|nr:MULTISPECIES: hypothetical protein [Klebsiella]HBR1245148.1 hypothetical protein [Klebsiella quasipneumoniae subsp. similipneumoniae]HCM6827731.1 hypothetical protein [Klebsiella quasipneumoniae subsp. quasipneumoniae]ASC12711.1 hypothetical protein AM486_18555 [Klebsiella pneumoniae]EIY5121382.1 hypothetical protein [Klebsiella quasipneumoniae]EIY5465588.1 hypothetical protein [Klebsiella quasipneumoniae]
MTISKEEFEELKARTIVMEAALAYTIANLSAKFDDIKPSVVKALKLDATSNSVKAPQVAKALSELAVLIESFNYTKD